MLKVNESIRVRVLVLVVVLMVGVTSLLSWYTLRQFEATTTFELEQEGILLSNALEASISPLAASGDVAGLQQQIDRLVAARERNDIEINIIFLQGDHSKIVASNDPGNIEATAPEEHANLLAALSHQRPVVTIGREEANEGQDDRYANLSPDTPDFYLLPGQRYLSITTPLVTPERQLGSINVVLSLARIDQELGATRQTLLIAQLIVLVLVIWALVWLLNHQIFNPLRGMSDKMQAITAGDLSQRIAYPGPTHEIGWLANAFDRMIDRLQAAFDREKRFTADVAHELRTPLTALKGRIGVTLSQPRTPTEYQQTLSVLEKEVDRLARLSNDLLFLTRLEQGQLRPEMEEQDFSDLMAAIIEQMQPLAVEKGVTLLEQIPATLLVVGDADHLIRLFINLLDNAIKYTPPDGMIDIQVEATNRYVLTRIDDSGPGIPAEHLPYLFDRYYRVDADRSRSSGGAGLGLSIAYEIARVHGGDINAESEPGGGATFIVRLPRFFA